MHGVFKWILSKSAVDPFARLRDADEEFDVISFSVIRFSLRVFSS